MPIDVAAPRPYVIYMLSEALDIPNRVWLLLLNYTRFIVMKEYIPEIYLNVSQ